MSPLAAGFSSRSDTRLRRRVVAPAAGSPAHEPAVMAGDGLNHAVRAHEIATDWAFQELSRTLHEWRDRFAAAFFGDLPLIFLKFEPLRRRTLAHYHGGRNGVAALHEVTLNTRYLEAPLYELLAALLHQMAHEWQTVRGTGGHGNYRHNRAFCDRCRALGIPCDPGYACIMLAYGDPFLSLVREHGVDVPPGAAPVRPGSDPDAPGPKKWSCGCASAWLTSAVEWECRRCGRPVRRVERDPGIISDHEGRGRRAGRARAGQEG
jgi:hypothetical protein